MNRALRFAALSGIMHFFLVAFLQVEQAYWILFGNPGADALRDASRATSILSVVAWPFFQFQTLLGSLTVASAVWLLASLGVAGRIVGFLAWFLFHSALVLDQMGVRLLGSHFNGTWVEGQAPSADLVFGSLMAEWSKIEGLNLGAVFLCGVILFFSWGRLSSQPFTALMGSPLHRIRTISLTFLLPLIVLAAVSQITRGYASLPLGPIYSHPVWSWAQGWGREFSGADLPTKTESLAAQDRAWPARVSDWLKGLDEKERKLAQELGLGVEAGRDAGPSALEIRSWESQVAASIKAKKKRPHVFVFVLESVGAIPILGEDGLPAQSVAPHLHKMAKSGLVATQLYTHFPATTRTHLSLVTGGETLTWGSVHDELNLKYRGQNLIQVFKQLGYKTAVISAGDLQVEGLDRFYEGLASDLLFDYGHASDDFRSKYQVHSWGGAEEGVLKVWQEWQAELGRKSHLAKAKSQQPVTESAEQAQEGEAAPTFTLFLGISSHHPYQVPSAFKGPFEEGGTGSLGRYLNAVAYNDSVIGRVRESLNTLTESGATNGGSSRGAMLVVLGDHGEAFGDRHKGNFLHKSHLYEENVRSFAIFGLLGLGVQSGAEPSSPLILSQPGSMGQIPQTILNMLDPSSELRAERGVPLKPFRMPGLLEGRESDPLVLYFHRGLAPERIGLRLGAHKILFDRGPWPEVLQSAQWFDLEADPLEQHNLLTNKEHLNKYLPLLKRCHETVLRWYVGANASFVGRLSVSSKGESTANSNAHPSQDALSPELASLAHFEILRFGVRGKDGVLATRTRFNPWEKVVAWIHWSDSTLPSEPAAAEAGGEVAPEGSSPSAKSELPQESLETPPQESIEVEWISPSQERIGGLVKIEADWTRVWIEHPLQSAQGKARGGRLEAGRWRLLVRRGERKVEGEFWVDPRVRLSRPLNEILKDQAASRASSRSMIR